MSSINFSPSVFIILLIQKCKRCCWMAKWCRDWYSNVPFKYKFTYMCHFDIHTQKCWIMFQIVPFMDECLDTNIISDLVNILCIGNYCYLILIFTRSSSNAIVIIISMLRATQRFVTAFKTQSVMVCPCKKKLFYSLRHTPWATAF